MDREEQIDRFINHEMTPREHQDFLREIDTDQELKEKVTLQALLAEAANRRAEQAAVKALRSRQPGRSKNLLFRSSIAAAAVVVLCVLFFTGNGYRYSTTQLYATHYQTPEIELSRGEHADITGTLNQAIACLQQQQPHEAISLLNQTALLSSPYGEEAEWLLLCAYLQTGEREKAEATARAIQQKQGVFASKADEILKQLKEKRWF